MSLDISAFKYARWERYCQLSATVFLGYEYLLQFSGEVELFWKKRWSFGKCLFLWSRYYSLVFNITNAIVFMRGNASYDLCNHFFRWLNTGASLQVVTTHIILELRLYAMYQSSRIVLCVCILLTLCEATAMGVIFGIPKAGIVETNNPSPGLFICADSDPPRGEHRIAFYWTSILTTETILLSLSAYKGYQNHKSGVGGSLMRELTRHSVLYFVLIFWVYVMNQVLWLVNILTLTELGTGFSFAISAVLANRLMIAVRERYYYCKDGEEGLSYMPSLQFCTRTTEDSTFTASSGPGTSQWTASGVRHTDPEIFGDESTIRDSAAINEHEMDKFDDRRGF